MATRNIAPVSDNEGGIGTPSKKWAKGYFYEMHIESNITDGTNTTTVAEVREHLDTTVGNPHGVHFSELEDTPNDYAGKAGKGVKVNITETGLEFTDADIDSHASRHNVGGADEIDVRGLQGGWLTADTEANRPPAGRKDRYFYATDTGKLYYDDGTNWIEIKPSPGTHGNEAHDPDMLPLDTSSAIEAYMSGNKWLSVATSGIVGLPKQSVVSVYLSTEQEIPSDTLTLVELDTKIIDIQNEFDTTNHRFTATEGGIYLILGRLQWKGDTIIADNKYSVSIYKNGEFTSVGDVHSSHSAYITSLTFCVLSLDQGDYVELYARNFSSGTAVLSPGAADTHLYIAKIA